MVYRNVLRFSLFLLALLVITTSLSAQKKFDKEFYIGAKGGVTFSRVRFYPNVEQNLLQGNSAGLMFRMISEPHIGLQLELNYVQKGWREKPYAELSDDYYYHTLDYFEIPVMTHVSLGSKALRFTLNLGPSVAFLASDKQGIKPSGLFPDGADFGNEYWGDPIESKVDFLFTGGLGVEYHTKKIGVFSLEGRIFYSLPNLFDADKYSYNASQSNGAQVTLAYLFRLDRKKS